MATNFGIIYFSLQAERDKANEAQQQALRLLQSAQTMFDTANARFNTFSSSLALLDTLDEVAQAKKDPPIQGTADTQAISVDG